MQTVCEKEKCTGCMACVDTCSKNAISIVDSLLSYNAFIDNDKCIHCGACHKVCQNNSENELKKPIAWYQGWSFDEKVRSNSSSGGAAFELSKTFVEQGGVVFSCAFLSGQFTFECADNVQDLKKFTGSKYVKSNPQGVYSKIASILRSGKKVLFLGLPCQVSALKKYIGNSDNLLTVDLICHGSPSPKLLDTFLRQYGYTLDTICNIEFRKNNNYQIYTENKVITQRGGRDRYTIAFLNGLIHTENCYKCQFARIERVSDITIGDSWGNDLPIKEQKKGVSLLLIQTEKGKRLVQQSAMTLTSVELSKAIKANHQLQYPSKAPDGRNTFFAGLQNGKKFNSLVKNAFPKQCIRQDIKMFLTKVGMYKGV